MNSWQQKCRPSSTERPRYQLWFPNIFEFRGGIQAYSAFLLRAMEELRPNSPLEVFLKNDTGAPLTLAIRPETKFHFAGSSAPSFRTAIYAGQIVSSAIRHRPARIIATHLHFAPLAHYLHRCFAIPYWIVAHGIEAWNITRPKVHTALKHAERILAVSDYTKSRLLEAIDLRSDSIGLLPNTFDESRFALGAKPVELLSRYGISAEQPVLLTVARLASEERYKGYDQVLEALPRVREHFPNVRYLIVGAGDDLHRVRQSIEKRGLSSHANAVGFVSDEELCAHYNLCDLFVMPSMGEGFGIVYLEALACGKPVLAGNADGSRDALNGGELGVLEDPRNIPALASSIVSILQKRHPHPRLYESEWLRKRVLEQFGFDAFRAQLGTMLAGAK